MQKTKQKYKNNLYIGIKVHLLIFSTSFFFPFFPFFFSFLQSSCKHEHVEGAKVGSDRGKEGCRTARGLHAQHPHVSISPTVLPTAISYKGFEVVHSYRIHCAIPKGCCCVPRRRKEQVCWRSPTQNKTAPGDALERKDSSIRPSHLCGCQALSTSCSYPVTAGAGCELRLREAGLPYGSLQSRKGSVGRLRPLGWQEDVQN